MDYRSRLLAPGVPRGWLPWGPRRGKDWTGRRKWLRKQKKKKEKKKTRSGGGERYERQRQHREELLAAASRRDRPGR